MNTILNTLSQMLEYGRNRAMYDLLATEYAEELDKCEETEIAMDYIRIKCINEFTEILKNRIAQQLIEKAKNANLSMMKIDGHKLSFQTRHQYNFNEDAYWKKLQLEFECAKDQIKQHQDYLISLTDNVDEIVTITDKWGKSYTLTAPKKSSKTFLFLY
jgi:hypothetical protein